MNFVQKSSKSCRGVTDLNRQKVNLMELQYLNGGVPQSQRSEPKTITCEALESQLVFPVCHSVAHPLTVYTAIFSDYEPTLTRWKTMKEFIFLSEFFCGYCLDTCLFACKRRSLDDQYFMVIFKLKVDKKVGIAVRLTELETSLKLQKQGKNY